MDQNQQDTTFEESMKQVMATLPPVIREYLTTGKYTPVAKSLMAKYGLRIDQGGVLEREIMLLLMGVETPDEFVQTLAEEAHLDQKTIGSIVQDVNDQIFVPLRKEEEQGSKVVNVPQPSKPIIPVHDRSQTSVNSNIAPLPPKTLMPAHASETLGDVVRSILPPPLPSSKALDSTVQPKNSVNLLEKNEESYKGFNNPVNLPGAMPPQSVPTIAKSISPASAEPRITLPPLKSYSSDPYREPVDEPLSEM